MLTRYNIGVDTYDMVKKLFLILITLLVSVACQKESLSSNLYSADTIDGRIFVEFLKGHDCLV